MLHSLVSRQAHMTWKIWLRMQANGIRMMVCLKRRERADRRFKSTYARSLKMADMAGNLMWVKWCAIGKWILENSKNKKYDIHAKVCKGGLTGVIWVVLKIIERAAFTACIHKRSNLPKIRVKNARHELQKKVIFSFFSLLKLNRCVVFTVVKDLKLGSKEIGWQI